MNQETTSNLNIHVGADKNENIIGNYNLTVTGNQVKSVLGDKQEDVAGSNTKKIMGWEDTLNIGDYKVVNLAAKVSASVGAEAKFAYSAGVEMTAGHKLVLDKSKKHNIGKDDWTLHCAKKINQKAAQEINLDSVLKVVISAGTQLMLRCGQSTITLKPGKIVIGSPQIVLGGKGSVKVESKGGLDLKGSAPLKANGAVVKLN
jgi:hypothetical protein